MASKKRNSRASALLGAAALLVLLAVIGLVSGLYLHGRMDLTRGRHFTLSRASLTTLESIPDIVTIKAVISRDLPVQFQQRRVEVMDLLEEFEERSDGKVRVLIEDPGENDARRASAEALGVREVALQGQDRGDFEVKKGYFGLAVLYGDKKEVLPVIETPQSLEYDIIVKIKRLTGETRTIGIVEGLPSSRFTLVLPGEGQPTTTGFEQNFPTLKAQMERLYEVKTVDVAYAPVDTGVDLLIVAAPARLEEQEKFHIDQFLMRGKPVIFMTPGMSVNLLGALSGQPTSNGYEDLLSFYGVGVSKNVLLEPISWEQISLGSDGATRMPYPYWMVENYTQLNSENPITSTLPGLSFPWASSIELLPKTDPRAGRVEVLARTSMDAWEETGPVFLGARDLMEFVPASEMRSYPLAVLRSGPLKSYYSDFLPPGITGADSAGRLAASVGEPRILVIGSALFATDFYVGYTRAVTNIHMILNALDQLALDPDLIRIRSRQVDASPLDEGRAAAFKTPLIAVNLLLAPSLLLLFGIIAGIRRRKREIRS
jgi:ABC-type uncharacterized transport system involved in gliding motility auxiliary subunit